MEAPNNRYLALHARRRQYDHWKGLGVGAGDWSACGLESIDFYEAIELTKHMHW